MDAALDLFTLPPVSPPYQKGSPTSKEAARRVAGKAPSQRERVAAAILAAGIHGITRKELEGVTGFLTQSLCARIRELKVAGVVMPRAVEREGCEILVHRDHYPKGKVAA